MAGLCHKRASRVRSGVRRARARGMPYGPPDGTCRAPHHSRRPARVLRPPRRARNAVWDTGELTCTCYGAHPRAGYDKAPPPRSLCLRVIPSAHEWPKNHKTAHDSGHGCAVGDFAVGWSTLRHVRSGSGRTEILLTRSTCVPTADGTFPVAVAHPGDPRTFAYTPTNCAMKFGPDLRRRGHKTQKKRVENQKIREKIRCSREKKPRDRFCAPPTEHMGTPSTLPMPQSRFMLPLLCFTQGGMFEFDFGSRAWSHLYPRIQMKPGTGK